MKFLRKINIILIVILTINLICPIKNINAAPTLLSNYSDYETFKKDLQALSYPLNITINTKVKEPNMATYNKYKLVVYGYLGEYSTKKDVYGEYEYLGWNRYGSAQPNAKYNDTGSGDEGFDSVTYVTTDMNGNDISGQATLSWSTVTSEYYDYNKGAKLYYNGSPTNVTVNQIGKNKAILLQQATLINEGSVRVYFTSKDGSNKRYATLTIPAIPYQNVLQGSIITDAEKYSMDGDTDNISIGLQANAQIIPNSSDGTDKFFKDTYINALTARITQIQINGKEVYSSIAIPPTFDDNAYGISTTKTMYTISPLKSLVLNRNQFTEGKGQFVKIIGYMAYSTLQGKSFTIPKEKMIYVDVEPNIGRSLKVNYIDTAGKVLSTSQTIKPVSDANVTVPKKTIAGYTPIKYINVSTGAEEIYSSSKTYSESVAEGKSVEVSFVYDKKGPTPIPTVTASTSPSELKANIGTVKVDVSANGLVSNYNSSSNPRISKLTLYCEPKGQSSLGQTYNLNGDNSGIQKKFAFDIDTKDKNNNEKQEFNITFTVTYANGTTAKVTTITDLTFKSDNNITLAVNGNPRNEKYKTGDTVRVELQANGTIDNKFTEATESVLLFVKQMPIGWSLGNKKEYTTLKNVKLSTQIPGNSKGNITGSYSDFTFDVKANNQEFIQYFEIELVTMIKGKIYSETKYVAVNIYKELQPPIINNKPTAHVSVDSIVPVDTIVNLSGLGNDVDTNDKLLGGLLLDGMQIDNKQSDNNNISLSKQCAFSQEGNHTLSMVVYDEAGDYDIDNKDFKVVVPAPALIIKTNKTLTQLGDVKVNRKYNIDISGSYPGSSAATINWSKTTWKVEPYQELSQDDIKIKQPTSADGDKVYPQSLSILSKKTGKYKVTVTIQNSYGKTDTKEVIVDVSPDVEPKGNFINDKSILRDPVTGIATFNLIDNVNNGQGQYSVSEDFDIISKRAYVYSYDENFNKTCTDDKWYIYNSSTKKWVLIANTLAELMTKDVFASIYNCGNETNVNLQSNLVGDYAFRLFVKEDFGQPTINEFITNDDYLVNNTELNGKIINTAPIGELSPIVQEPANVTIQILTDYKGEKLTDINSKLTTMKSELNDKVSIFNTEINGIQGENIKDINLKKATTYYAGNLYLTEQNILYYQSDAGFNQQYLYKYYAQAGPYKTVNANFLYDTNASIKKLAENVKWVTSTQRYIMYVTDNYDLYRIGGDDYNNYPNNSIPIKVCSLKSITSQSDIKEIVSDEFNLCIILEDGSIYYVGTKYPFLTGDYTDKTVINEPVKLNNNFTPKQLIFKQRGQIISLDTEGNIWTMGTNNIKISNNVSFNSTFIKSSKISNVKYIGLYNNWADYTQDELVIFKNDNSIYKMGYYSTEPYITAAQSNINISECKDIILGGYTISGGSNEIINTRKTIYFTSDSEIYSFTGTNIFKSKTIPQGYKSIKGTYNFFTTDIGGIYAAKSTLTTENMAKVLFPVDAYTDTYDLNQTITIKQSVIAYFDDEYVILGIERINNYTLKLKGYVYSLKEKKIINTYISNNVQCNSTDYQNVDDIFILGKDKNGNINYAFEESRSSGSTKRVYLGNFSSPVILENIYSNIATDGVSVIKKIFNFNNTDYIICSGYNKGFNLYDITNKREILQGSEYSFYDINAAEKGRYLQIGTKYYDMNNNFNVVAGTTIYDGVELNKIIECKNTSSEYYMFYEDSLYDNVIKIKTRDKSYIVDTTAYSNLYGEGAGSIRSKQIYNYSDFFIVNIRYSNGNGLSFIIYKNAIGNKYDVMRSFNPIYLSDKGFITSSELVNSTINENYFEFLKVNDVSYKSQNNMYKPYINMAGLNTSTTDYNYILILLDIKNSLYFKNLNDYFVSNNINNKIKIFAVCSDEILNNKSTEFNQNVSFKEFADLIKVTNEVGINSYFTTEIDKLFSDMQQDISSLQNEIDLNKQLQDYLNN